MSNKLQAIRGMNDVLPKASYGLQRIENTFSKLAVSYGYREFRTPILESTRLFKRSIGEVTDIVEKEMYTFTDKNGEQVTMRPEGTAGIVRGVIEHGLLREGLQKYWYSGPMFRHEKPQKGRYRQFQQFGLEVFGAKGVAVELEIIALCRDFWQKIGIDKQLCLEINTLGTAEERQVYRACLVEYFEAHQEQLDEDSQKRLTRSPLRILDSKNPDMKALIEGAPKLLDSLTDESKAHFEAFCQGLDALGIAYTINTKLVRGLDYYQHTVFEWVTDTLGSQATVCAGGRFDGLVEQLGGPSTPAFGLAMGQERLNLMVEQLNPSFLEESKPLLYLMPHDTMTLAAALELAADVRAAVPGAPIEVHLTGGKMKAQFKKADKSGARLAVILGEEEHANGEVSIKYLREEKSQTTISQDKLIPFIHTYLEQEM